MKFKTGDFIISLPDFKEGYVFGKVIGVDASVSNFPLYKITWLFVNWNVVASVAVIDKYYTQATEDEITWYSL